MAHVALLPHQLEFMKSTYRNTMLVTGRAGGKSFVAGQKGIQLIAEGKSFIATAPSYRQLKHTLFKALIDTFKFHSLAYSWNKSEMTIEVANQIIYGVSGEAYESGRGITNVTGLLMDEAAMMPAESVKVLKACLRGQKDPELYMMSTPRGKSNWLYDYSLREDCKVITATTFDNFKVSKAYHDEMRIEYGESQFADQELRGEFVDFCAGLLQSKWLKIVPPSFDRPKELTRSYDLAVTKKAHSDYSATCLLGKQDERYKILETERYKMEWPELKRTIIANALRDGTSVPIVIESFATQIGLIQDLQSTRELSQYSVRGIAPKGDKLNKIMPFAIRMEAGSVDIVRNPASNLLLFGEMDSFTGDGKGHDDQIDAMALAYYGINTSPIIRPVKIKGLY